MPGGLSGNAFAAGDRLFTRLLLTGETISGHPDKAAMIVLHIQGRDDTAQVLRTKLQDTAPQQVQRQLTEDLLCQFGLPLAQPGLLFQAPSALLLRGQVGTVAFRKADQVPTPDVGQQAADAGDEQHVQGDAPDRRATNLFVARGTQLLLHAGDVFVLFADFVGQALATTGLHHRAVVAAATLQVDHRLGIGIPLGLQRLDPTQPVKLYRVVRRQLLQGVKRHHDSRLRRFIGVKEVRVTGQQITAHAGFQVNRQLHRFVGVIDHPVGMLDPLHDRHQVGDQGDKEHHAEDTQPQRQTDVTTQEFAKALLINRRRSVHWEALVNCRKRRSLPQKRMWDPCF
ncbi:hypothetical protein D3C84_150590 [compost metagenome]